MAAAYPDRFAALLEKSLSKGKGMDPWHQRDRRQRVAYAGGVLAELLLLQRGRPTQFLLPESVDPKRTGTLTNGQLLRTDRTYAQDGTTPRAVRSLYVAHVEDYELHTLGTTVDMAPGATYGGYITADFLHAEDMAAANPPMDGRSSLSREIPHTTDVVADAIYTTAVAHGVQTELLRRLHGLPTPRVG